MGLVIFAVILTVIILLLSLNVRLEILYENDEISRKTTAFLRYGFIKYRLYPKKQKKEYDIEKNEDKSEDKSREKELSFEKKKAEIEKYIKIFNTAKNEAVKLLSYAAKHAAVFEKVEVKSEFGFDDAMQTGIFTGIYNGFVYGVMGIIHNTSKLKSMDIKLSPVFGKKCFYNRFYCILHVKTVHIIIIALWVLKIIRKIKKEGRK